MLTRIGEQYGGRVVAFRRVGDHVMEPLIAQETKRRDPITE